ncbi:MAG: TolC family protein [Verrucomicrobiales bacterium]
MFLIHLRPLPAASLAAAATILAAAPSAQCGETDAGAATPGLPPIAAEDAPHAGEGGVLTLGECIAAALRHNLPLEAERLRVESAARDVTIAKSTFDPATAVQGAYSDRRSPVASSELDGASQPENKSSQISTSLEKRLATGATISLDADVLDRSETNSSFARLNPEYNSRVSLNLRQPLLKGSGIGFNRSEIKLAELGVDESHLSLEQRANDVLLAVETAYWRLAAVAQAVAIRKRAVALANLIEEEATERLKVELGTPLDVLEAQAALAERQEILLLAQKAERDARDLLWREMGVLGRAEPAFSAVQALPAAALPEGGIEGSYRRAAAAAPETLLADKAVQAREIQLMQAAKNKQPELDVGVRSGLLGRDGSQGRAAEALAERDGYFWEATLEFRIPWGLRAERARFEQAEKALAIEKLNADQARLELLAGIRSAWRDFELAQKRVSAAALTLELNQRRFEEQKAKRASGQSTMRELLEAQADMEDAELRLLEARVDLTNAEAEIARREGSMADRHGVSIAP